MRRHFGVNPRIQVAASENTTSGFLGALRAPQDVLLFVVFGKRITCGRKFSRGSIFANDMGVSRILYLLQEADKSPRWVIRESCV